VKELGQILQAVRQRPRQPLALATVVRIHGSSYRGIGTRMLITEKGETIGAVSAGCLESDIAQKSRVMTSGSPLLLSYDTRRLFGCDGAIDVLIERMAPENPWFDFLAQSLEGRRPGISLTIFEENNEGSLGTHPLLLDHEWCKAAPLARIEQFENDARNAFVTERSGVVTVGETSALLHFIQPPVHLIVAGAAYDAVPLFRLGQALGWRVTILARPEDDPYAFDGAEVLPVTAPDEWPLAADARTAGVIMTHHFGRDFAFLRQMLRLPFGYLGLLGPRQRRERLVAALEEQSDFAELTRLHNPAGLDLGAETSEEIALAITGEIQAVMTGARAGSLRERKGPIHENRAARASATLAGDL